MEDPLNVLIRTVLSQNTTDTNSQRAYDTLKEHFPDWNAVRLAPRGRIENAIRTGGLARIKALRIKAILSKIHSEYGNLSLEPLCGMNAETALAALLAHEGVGLKTANCVLLFGCGMNVFPVDTHILRISKRLGLIPSSASLEQAHTIWAQYLPNRLALSLHVNLIVHGRRTCLARTPICQRCCLRHVCVSGDRAARIGKE